MRLHHAALVSSSETHADRFYGDILKLRKIKATGLKSDLASRLFDIDAECLLILYENDNFAIEVFVPNRVPTKKETFRHLCLEVDDREGFLESCRSAGLKIKLVPKGDSQICFVQDFDGNQFEIKQVIS